MNKEADQVTIDLAKFVLSGMLDDLKKGELDKLFCIAVKGSRRQRIIFGDMMCLACAREIDERLCDLIVEGEKRVDPASIPEVLV